MTILVIAVFVLFPYVRTYIEKNVILTFKFFPFLAEIHIRTFHLVGTIQVFLSSVIISTCCPCPEDEAEAEGEDVEVLRPDGAMEDEVHEDDGQRNGAA